MPIGYKWLQKERSDCCCYWIKFFFLEKKIPCNNLIHSQNVLFLAMISALFLVRFSWSLCWAVCFWQCYQFWKYRKTYDNRGITQREKENDTKSIELATLTFFLHSIMNAVQILSNRILWATISLVAKVAVPPHSKL